MSTAICKLQHTASLFNTWRSPLHALHFRPSLSRICRSDYLHSLHELCFSSFISTSSIPLFLKLIFFQVSSHVHSIFLGNLTGSESFPNLAPRQGFKFFAMCGPDAFFGEGGGDCHLTLIPYFINIINNVESASNEDYPNDHYLILKQSYLKVRYCTLEGMLFTYYNYHHY